jgi:hypothetical protein
MADARVLTFSEVKRLPRRVSSGIPVCMEERYPLGTFDKGSNTKYMDSYFIVQEYVLDGGNYYNNPDTYGMTWRVWNIKPTKKQKEAEPWLPIDREF